MNHDKYNYSLTVAGVCFILIIGLVFVASVFRVSASTARPEVFILREYVVETDKGPALLVDYTIGGMASNAFFYDNEMDTYLAFKEMLKREGRIHE